MLIDNEIWAQSTRSVIKIIVDNYIKKEKFSQIDYFLNKQTQNRKIS